MGSLGFGELLFIGVVALIVFGPRRLPEIARRAGDLMARARAATKELTDSIDAEFDGASAPLRDLQDEYRATKTQLSDTTSKLTDITAVGSSPPRAVEPGDDGVTDDGDSEASIEADTSSDNTSGDHDHDHDRGDGPPPDGDHSDGATASGAS
ncbi:MAG: twin-arginine translocase TatA/TatE family subunit [Acidimicrobiia bacterium]|nr:twin-arginine translocase TatA/TatE family subunit [Acidimicrobiia bacterium]